MPFLPPNQQRQSTEGNVTVDQHVINYVHPAMMRSSLSQVQSTSLTIDEFYWHTINAEAKFSNSSVCSTVPEGSTLSYGGTWISLQHSLERVKESSDEKNWSACLVVSRQYWLVTDRQMDRQTHNDSIYHASIVSCGNDPTCVLQQKR